MNIYTPTREDLQAARVEYEAREPRGLFYRVATELVDLAIGGLTSITLAEALAVLLQTWNRSFYQYRGFDSRHFADIDSLLTWYQRELLVFRQRPIETLSEVDEPVVKRVFAAYEEVLAPVGAAKCLHLLAPRFFPIWDRTIAEKYRLPLKRQGFNADNYWQFMLISGEQCRSLGGERAMGPGLLKAIDEFNYCRYTMNRDFNRDAKG